VSRLTLAEKLPRSFVYIVSTIKHPWLYSTNASRLRRCGKEHAMRAQPLIAVRDVGASSRWEKTLPIAAGESRRVQ
jgi:hypothetical protein